MASSDGGAKKAKILLSPRQFLIIFFLGLAYTIVYATPFIQYVFYNPLVDSLKVSNASLGVLITIFGIGNLISPLGGILSDKFNAKTFYIIGMVGTVVMNVLFATFMNYKFALFTWAMFAFFGLVIYFPAHIKLSRLVGSESQQGTVFGWVESFCGITNVIVNYIALYLFAKFATDKFGTAGLKACIYFYAIVGIIAVVAVVFLVPKPTNEQMDKKADEVMTMKDWGNVLKDPRTWMSGLAVFATYTMYCTLSYYTPYFSDVLGVAVVFTGGMAIIRQYGTRFVGAPIGGWLGDRIKSVSTVVGLSLAGCVIFVLIFMFLPKGTPAAILLVMTLITAVFSYMARGSMFAVPSELKIPRKYSGSTSGVVCAIGYCPDLFIFVLYGKFLDKYGNAGYNRIFIYAAIVMLIGVVNAFLVRAYKKKHNITPDSEPIENN